MECSTCRERGTKKKSESPDRRVFTHRGGQRARTDGAPRCMSWLTDKRIYETVIVQAEQSTVQSYKCALSRESASRDLISDPSPQHLYGEHKEKPLKIPWMMVMTF